MYKAKQKKIRCLSSAAAVIHIHRIESLFFTILSLFCLKRRVDDWDIIAFKSSDQYIWGSHFVYVRFALTIWMP